MELFTECDHLRGRLRDICRDEAGLPLNGPNSTNAYRVKMWGLPPIGGVGISKPAQRITTIQRAGSLVRTMAKTAIRKATTGQALVGQDVIDARLAICQTCPNFVAEKTSCKLCGCSCSAAKTLANKLAHASSVCPDTPPRWGRYEPSRADMMTPVLADISDTRNLLWHLWPNKHSPNWRIAVAQLLKRIDLFNGVRSIAVAVDHDTVTLADVQREFGDTRINNWITVANNPKIREGASFLRLMDTLPHDDSVTFWGHGKSVRHHDGSICVDWAEQQYRLLLDYWPQIELALQRFPIATCFKRYMKFGPKCKHRWHGSGGAWWMRQKDVFAVDGWHNQLGKWFGATEGWPGGVFQASQAYCVGPDDVGDLYKPEGWESIREPMDALHRVRAKLSAGELDDETFFAQSEWKGYTSWDWRALVETHTRGANMLKDLGCQTALEIGSGLGYFLAGAKSIGLDAVGVDRNALERSFAVSRGVSPERYHLGMVSDYLITTPVDGIYSVEVFEHCTDEELRPLCEQLAANCRWFYFTSTPHAAADDARWGHVNIKSRDEWIAFFAQYGLALDRNDTGVCEWGMILRGHR